MFRAINLKNNWWTKLEKLAKNLILGLILACLTQTWFPKKIFCEFYLYYMLYIVASYHCMQFHKKTNQPNLRKWHKTYFWAWFLLLWPKFGPQRFFCRFYLHQMLEIVGSYHSMLFEQKIMNQTWENGKNLVLGLIFAPLAQIWSPRIFS